MSLITALLILLAAFLTEPPSAFAQGMMDRTGSQTATVSDNHTARKEQEGKQIWEKLQAKQLECNSLTDDSFSSLGEYFMGQMVGNSHETMNNMMSQMMGQPGEEQMHVVMGKRLSGCLPEAEFPQTGVGFMPMMWMGWFGFGSWAVTLALLVWLAAGILAIIWLLKQIRKK